MTWKAAKTKQYNATTEAQAAEGQDMTDWNALLGPEVMRLVADIQAGEDVPEIVLGRIEKLAPGVDPNVVINQILNSLAIHW